MTQEEKELKRKKRAARKARREEKLAKEVLVMASDTEAMIDQPTYLKLVSDALGLAESPAFSDTPTQPAIEVNENSPLLDKRTLPQRVWKLVTSRWMLLIPALVVIVLGFFLMMLWGQNRDNVFLATGGIVSLPIGGYLIYWVWSKRHDDDNVVVVLAGGISTVGKKKKWPAVNSLNIYAHKETIDGVEKIHTEKIAFEQLPEDELLGQPQQCINNKNWYYVHIFDLASGKLKAFMLPDSEYFDPSEFARVIEMPANKKLFARTASMFQKVAVGGMLIALAILSIVLIAVQPPPT